LNRNTKILFSLFQKLDYRDKENSAKKKLTGILIAYIFANTVLSYNYFVSFDERSYIILALTSNLFLLALIVLTDFENLFLASRYIDVLRTLPVESSSVFKAKFFSAVIFLLFFILSSAIPQVVFFYFIDHSLLKTLAFLATDVMFCYFSVGILILIFIFALKFFKDKATLILNFLQILFFVFIFYSSTLSSKVRSVPKELFVRENILNIGIVKYIPQTFFSLGVYDILYFTVSTALAAGIFFFLFRIIGNNYYSLADTVRSLNTKRKLYKPKFNPALVNTFLNRYVLSNNYERASFDLVKNQFRNSKFLRVKYIPIIFMPLLFVVIGIISGSPNLLFFNINSGADSFFRTAIVLISPSITFTLIMCSRLLISNTKILDESSVNTGWIYDSLPIKERRQIIKGSDKFVYAAFIFPLLISISILLSFKADITVVLSNILYISSGMYFINSVSLLFDKTYPFTLESTKFSSASKFIEIFIAMIMGMILFLIQIFVFQNIIFVIISILFFIIVSILLNRN
jgi:hypothetical protein